MKMLKFKWLAYRFLFYYFLYFSICLKYYIFFAWCSDLEPFCIPGENIKWYSCHGNSMAVRQTIKHRSTMWSSFSPPRCILKRVKNRDLNKYLHTYVHSRGIHRSQKADTYIKRWLCIFDHNYKKNEQFWKIHLIVDVLYLW